MRGCLFILSRSKARLARKKILTINEKSYIADHGIREAVFGENTKDVNLVFENLIFMELLRRGYRVTVGKLGVKEIEFVAEKQAEKIYIQVTYLLSSDQTIQREFGSLNAIKDNFPKFVVSYDEFDMSREGIKHFNIIDFLSEKKWT